MPPTQFQLNRVKGYRKRTAGAGQSAAPAVEMNNNENNLPSPAIIDRLRFNQCNNQQCGV